jgi:chromosome segregation ATPase
VDLVESLVCAGAQVILVAHNRWVIEAAREVVGVTMQEPGVLKVVEVRLRAGVRNC